MDNHDPLAKFRGVLPSRAELCQLALLGTSEKIRAAAQSVLDLLSPMTTKEKENRATSVWQAARLPSEADLAKSPIGKATLELLRGNPPMTVEKKLEGNVTPEPAPAQPSAPLAIPTDDGVNDYLKNLAWPPKSSLPPKALEDDDTVKHKWVAGRPSEPSKDLRPIADSDFSNNSPLY
jgi:hypothetical protein